MGMIELGSRDEIKKLYDTPANRRLKYCALGAIAVSVLLMLFMIIRMDALSDKVLLLLRGCAGLGAIIFVSLYVCLVYRVYREYFRQK